MAPSVPATQPWYSSMNHATKRFEDELLAWASQVSPKSVLCRIVPFRPTTQKLWGGEAKAPERLTVGGRSSERQFAPPSFVISKVPSAPTMTPCSASVKATELKCLLVRKD